jgi:hypothetical protein
MTYTKITQSIIILFLIAVVSACTTTPALDVITLQTQVDNIPQNDFYKVKSINARDTTVQFTVLLKEKARTKFMVYLMATGFFLQVHDSTPGYQQVQITFVDEQEKVLSTMSSTQQIIKPFADATPNHNKIDFQNAATAEFMQSINATFDESVSDKVVAK